MYGITKSRSIPNQSEDMYTFFLLCSRIQLSRGKDGEGFLQNKFLLKSLVTYYTCRKIHRFSLTLI